MIINNNITEMDNDLVIRIAGTSFSGSTMLDLMLANDKAGISCGEINALFRPYRKHHFNPQCGCGDPECSLWKEIRAKGESELWSVLPHMQPDKHIFVDSSKELVWLRDQTNRQLPAGIQAKNVLIWKTPLEFALSCWKRGKIDNWYRAYTTYHERYFSIIDHWYSVKYSELASAPSDKLKLLCNEIGIPYFSGKEKYWQRTHHTLFGSDSAKLHLYDKNDSSYSNIVDTRADHKDMVSIEDTDEVRHHKQIYSVDDSQFDVLPDQVRQKAENDPRLQAIIGILTETEISVSSRKASSSYIVENNIKPYPGWYVGGKIKRIMRSIRCRVG